MKMRMMIQLAAVVLLGGAAGVRAQVSNPDALIGKPPASPVRQRATPADDLQWLWQYAKPAPGGRANDLRLDARFQALLKDGFAQPQSMWGPEGSREPLSVVIPLFVSQYGAVYAEGNRYLTVDGCVPSFCAAEGLLWIDLGRKTSLAVFAAVNWTTEGKPVSDAGAEYNLWLFPNHELDPDALPLALTEAIAHWDVRLAAAHRMVPHIVHAILVEPDGTPAALNPELVGANTIAPQPDTVTPASPDERQDKL
jgi:hypothetical protein